MSGGAVTRQESLPLGAGITQQTAQAVAVSVGRIHEAWTIGNTCDRAALLAEICADGVTYTNPLMSCVGVQALAELISEFTGAHPGHVPVRTSGVNAHHDAAYYEWVLRDFAGRPAIGGIEIVRFTPEARLTSIVSFFTPSQPSTIRYAYQA